jgi:hypothetical protein
LVVGGCSDLAAPGDIGMSLEEAKTPAVTTYSPYFLDHVEESPHGSKLPVHPNDLGIGRVGRGGKSSEKSRVGTLPLVCVVDYVCPALQR